MKFSTRIDKPIAAEALFDAVADFDRVELILLRRGVSVTRIEAGVEAVRGWDLAFDWRGQRREVRLVLAQYDRPERLSLKGKSQPFDVKIDMTVVALSKKKSRLMFELEAKPRNMRARLTIQTAKLARAQLDKKFEKRVRQFVNDAVSSQRG